MENISLSDSRQFLLNGDNISMTNLGNDSQDNIATNKTNCTNDYCVSDEEYVDMIVEYITPTFIEWILIGVYFVVFAVGLIGNFLVCFAVWRNHSMRTVTNFFIVNLALADFFVCLICLPPTVLGDVTETWYIGSVMCKLTKYLQGVSVCVSVLTLSCISVERWYAICRPLTFKSTPERARLIICLIWMISLCLVIPEIVVLDTFPRLPGLTVLLTVCKPTWSYHSQAAYQLFLSVAMYVLPFLLMFVAYVQIARCLWSNNIPTETSRDSLHPRGEGICSSATQTQLQGRRKAAKMLIAVVVMFGICYMPVHLLNILRYAGALQGADGVATHFALVAHWLCYFNSAINPVIYNFMSAKFRKEFVSACACCLRSCSKGEGGQAASGRDAIYTYKYSHTGFTRANSPKSNKHRMTTVRI